MKPFPRLMQANLSNRIPFPQRWFVAVALGAATIALSPAAEDEIPVSSDPALSITKFAGSDLIKHPTGITFTLDGKLLVVESHTHFAPEDYEGPETDQIVWLQDTDADGKADTRKIFFEADLVATMDIATHPETGAIYVATRNEVLRLWDRNGDGRADPESVERRLVFLETTADYPHNGVSGLCFDDEGDLFFGIGENYGADYTLHGSDDSSIRGGGEGGNLWHVTRDGEKLRRFATGFWNPYGVCHAPGGHVFATDNDPSSRPPSRLHYVIDGGDYGYQYRYGRSGHHPFVSWNGELPGHLPMLHGSGEAPCDVIHYRGNLLVASWADHRLEVYPLSWDQTHFTTEQQILVQGGADFRPVAFAFHSNGDLFVSDWVKRDYNLHGHGAVWRIQGWKPEERALPSPTEVARHRVVSVSEGLPEGESFWSDPWLAPLTLRSLGDTIRLSGIADPHRRALLLLGWRLRDPSDPSAIISEALIDPDPTVRLLALKWICDEGLEVYRPEVERIAEEPDSPTLFHAAVTTLARLDGQPVDDKPIQRLIGARLQATQASTAVKRAAFQVLVDREKFLSIRDLADLFESTEDETLKADVLLSMLAHSDEAKARDLATQWISKDRIPAKLLPFAEAIRDRGSPRSLPEATALAGRPTDFAVASWDQFLAELPPSNIPTEIAGPLVFHRHCSACHQALGHGRRGGPDLSQIGERGREHILRSLLDPSAEVAPQYQAWNLTLEDGSQKVGFLLGQKGANHFYADAAGNEFQLTNRDIVVRQQLPVSIMPPGLAAQMGNREIRDLVEWLLSLKAK